MYRKLNNNDEPMLSEKVIDKIVDNYLRRAEPVVEQAVKQRLGTVNTHKQTISD